MVMQFATTSNLVRIAVLGIDHEIGAQLLGERELGVIDVDGANLEAHHLRILNGEMSEAACAGDDDQLACLRLRLVASETTQTYP